MSDRPANIRISAQDGASSVFDAVANNVSHSLDRINNAGNLAEQVAGKLTNLFEVMGVGKSKAAGLGDEFQKQASGLQQWISAGVEAIQTAKTLADNLNSLKQFGGSLGITLGGGGSGGGGVAAGGGGGGWAGQVGGWAADKAGSWAAGKVAGSAAGKAVSGYATEALTGGAGTATLIGTAIGLAIAKPVEYAIRLNAKDMDEATRQQSYAPESALKAERERAIWQAAQERSAEFASAAAADKAKNFGATNSLQDWLRSKQKDPGTAEGQATEALTGDAKADAEFMGKLNAMRARGEDITLDMLPEMLEQNRKITAEIEAQEAAEKRVKTEAEAAADAFGRISGKAADLAAGSMSKSQKFGKDLSEITDLWLSGMLTEEEAARSVGKSGFDNLPAKGKQPDKIHERETGSNVLQSHYLAGASSNSQVAELRKLQELQKKHLEAVVGLAKTTEEWQKRNKSIQAHFAKIGL